MIDAETFTRAFAHAQSLLEEHGVPACYYIGLDEAAQGVITRAISSYIDQTGLPTSRVALHQTLVDFLEVGLLIGIEISRDRVDRV
jgi:hypothetical protein